MTMDEEFEKLNKEMFEKFLKTNPTMGTLFGLHDPYDKLLPDGSSKRVFASLRLLEEWGNKMREKIKFDALTDENKIDWKWIEHVYELEKFSVMEHRFFETNPDAFDEIGSILFLMITRNYAPLEKRIEYIVSRLEKLPQYLEQFRTRFEKSQPIRLWTEVAIESCEQIPSLLQFIVSATRGRVPDKLHERLEQTVKRLDQPISQQLEWLKSLLPKTKKEWALGKEKLDNLLKARKLGMTADEIYALGVKYLKEMKEEQARIAKKISPGKSVEEAWEEIQNDAPKTFEEALKATQEQMEASRKFIIEHDLATVYEEDKLQVNETPGFMAPLIPFAALFAPAKFDKNREGNYVVTRPRDIKNLANHLNYSAIKNTAVHEGFPGHLLQGACSIRGSFVRMLTYAPETVEGWAHYCEQMMMEHGFSGDLKTRFVQLNDGIWRAVRIILDVKLSRGEMSFDEAVEMLMKEARMSKEAAIAEVRRYTQTPAYPLSYLLGKHLILKLRDDVKKKMGKKYSDKFFHDTITHNGELPIALLREVFEQKIAQL